MGFIDVEAIREGIPALKRCIYLNTGSPGPRPKVVADELARLYA